MLISCLIGTGLFCSCEWRPFCNVLLDVLLTRWDHRHCYSEEKNMAIICCKGSDARKQRWPSEIVIHPSYKPNFPWFYWPHFYGYTWAVLWTFCLFVETRIKCIMYVSPTNLKAVLIYIFITTLNQMSICNVKGSLMEKCISNTVPRSSMQYFRVFQLIVFIGQSAPLLFCFTLTAFY